LRIKYYQKPLGFNRFLLLLEINRDFYMFMQAGSTNGGDLLLAITFKGGKFLVLVRKTGISSVFQRKL